MPIYQTDPWRVQFFDHVHCPDDVIIPTKDWEAWPLYPAHRWIYDKLAVALSQGLDAAPHGVIPPRFPVFSKPMMNLRSMGAGSLPIPDIETYRASLTPGHFWCTLLTGAHVSTDAAIVNGNAVWWRHATGATAPGGTFDYWHIHAEAMPAIEDWCGAWASKHLAGYTGMVNFETIGSRIIEAHLRFADQWPDLYGPGWVEALVRLYAKGTGSSTTPTGRTVTASCCSPRTASLSPPATARARRCPPDRRRIQRADLLPSGPRPGAPFDAPRRLSPRHHQCHRSVRRPASPRPFEPEAVYNVIRTQRR